MFYRKATVSLCLLLVLGLAQAVLASADPPKITKNAVWAKIVKQGSHFTVKQLRLVGNEINYQKGNIYARKMYYGKVVSASGKVLAYFPAHELSAIACWDNFDTSGNIRGGCREMNEVEMELRIPYLPDGKRAEFFNLREEKILTIDISSVVGK